GGQLGTLLTSPVDPVSIFRYPLSKSGFSLLASRKALYFSMPKSVQNKSVRVAVYALSGQEPIPSRMIRLHGKGERVAIGNLQPGQFVFTITAGDKIYSKPFSVLP